jgi:DHA2 family multidrug resistance protein
VGTSIAGTVWNNRTVLHHERLTEVANTENRAFTHQIDMLRSLLHLDIDAAHRMFDSMLNAQAAMMGLNDIFFMSAVIFLLIIPLIWITRPVKGGGGADASAAH